MSAIFIEINPDNPQERLMQQVIECLQNGGVIIYPTDTIYGLGCDIFNQKALQRVCQIKNIKPAKINLSFICYDLSDISQYAKQVDNRTFKLMKKALPGPFTFILRTGNQLPKTLRNRKGTIGVRIPDHPISQSILDLLEGPMLSASLRSGDDLLEYENDPVEIQENFGSQLDLVVDGGIGGRTPSAVIDCTDGEAHLIREGVIPLRF